MKKLSTPNENGTLLESEGKLVEIIPIIYTGSGELLSLPPTTYRVPNWLIGLQKDHIVGYPYQMMFNERIAMPGGSYSHMLSFYVRILEDSPDMKPNFEAINELITNLHATKEDAQQLSQSLELGD